MFCTKCGNKLIDGAVFCTKCGNKISVKPSANNTEVKESQEQKKVVVEQPIVNEEKDKVVDEATVIVNNPPVQPVQPMPQPVQPMPQPVQPMPQPVQKSKKKGSVVVVILLVLINVALIAGGLVLILKYISLNNETNDNVLVKAEKYMEEADYEKAISEYEKVIKDDSKNVDAYIGLADAYIANGNYEKAIEMLNEANEDLEDSKIEKKISKIEAEYDKEAEGNNGQQTQTEVSTEIMTAAPTEASTEALTSTSRIPEDGVQIQYMGMEGTIQQLIDENINFSVNMYHFGSLPTVGGEVNLNLKKVDTSYFTSFNEYVQYVHTLYKKERADKLISDAKYFAGSNGELLLNTAFGLTAAEYNIDWSCYIIEITSQTSTECEFSVVAREKATAQNPNPQDYQTSGKIIKENGRWVLEKEVY